MLLNEKTQYNPFLLRLLLLLLHFMPLQLFLLNIFAFARCTNVRGKRSFITVYHELGWVAKEHFVL